MKIPNAVKNPIANHFAFSAVGRTTVCAASCFLLICVVFAIRGIDYTIVFYEFLQETKKKHTSTQNIHNRSISCIPLRKQRTLNHTQGRYHKDVLLLKLLHLTLAAAHSSYQYLLAH